jgi:hypothetical protein
MGAAGWASAFHAGSVAAAAAAKSVTILARRKFRLELAICISLSL